MNIKKIFMLMMIGFPIICHAELKDITVMALGPVDGRAVIKTGDGKMQVLKIGDKVQGTKAIVKQVLTDRLVVSEFIQEKPPVMEDVWIYKPGKPGEKSRIQRLDRKGPPKKLIEMQEMKVLGSSKN